MRALDLDMAHLCAWLKAHGYTAHVDRNQKIILRKKENNDGR